MSENEEIKTIEDLRNEEMIQAMRKYYEDVTNDSFMTSDYEALVLAKIVSDVDSKYKNIGFNAKRTKHPASFIEKALQEAWLEENARLSFINDGRGILGTLIYPHAGDVSDRERMIVATIIQWLGSNVGQGFLHKALGSAGFRIVQVDKK